MNYNVTVNGKVYSVTVEKTGAAAPAAVAPVAAPVAAAPVAAPAPAAAPKAAAPAAPAVNTAKEQEILAAVIAAVTEDLGPSASRMQITSINKI